MPRVVQPGSRPPAPEGVNSAGLSRHHRMLLALGMLLLVPHISAGAHLSRSSTVVAEGAAYREGQEDVDLELVLERLARLAGLYRDEALSFSCDEVVTETHYRTDGRVTEHRSYEFQYIYVPDDSGDGRLLDYRTRKSEAGDPAAPHVDLREVGIAAYLTRAYSWAFLFQPQRQRRYDFDLLGVDEEVFGRRALLIAFEPVPPYEVDVNDWFGRAWVDAETFQLLQVEALRSSDLLVAAEARRAQEELDLEESAYIFLETTTEFREVKNGMRFPTEVTLEVTSLRPSGGLERLLGLAQDFSRGIHMSRRSPVIVRQVYSDYSFFSVRTEAEIRDMILGTTRRKRR